MKNHLKLASAAVAACLAAVGCGKTTPVNPEQGQVKLSLTSKAALPSSAAVAAPPPVSMDVCGDWTFTPYTLDASGNQGPQAGSPLVLLNTGGGTALDAITGCFDTLTGQNDWRWWVTVTNFHFCDGHALPPGWSISPATVTTTLDIDCEALVDIQKTVDINVSISVPGTVGYVDITTNINETFVTQQCKQHDIVRADSTGLTSRAGFAQLVSSDPALIGADVVPNIVQEWVGSIFGPVGGADLRAYYTTEQFLTPLNTGVAVFQVGVKDPGIGQNYLATGIPWCRSKIDWNGTPSTATAATQATLASAVLVGALKQQQALIPGFGIADLAPANINLTFNSQGYNLVKQNLDPIAVTPAVVNQVLSQDLPADAKVDSFNFNAIYPTMDGRFATLYTVNGDQWVGVLGLNKDAFALDSTFLLAGASQATLNCLGLNAKNGVYGNRNCTDLVGKEVERTKSVFSLPDGSGGLVGRGYVITKGGSNPPPPVARWDCSYNGDGQACSCTYIRPDGTTGGTYSGTGTSGIFGWFKSCDISSSL